MHTSNSIEIYIFQPFAIPSFPRVILVVCISTYRSTKRKTNDEKDDGDGEDDEGFVGPQGGVLVHDPRQDRLQHGKLRVQSKVKQDHPKVNYLNKNKKEWKGKERKSYVYRAEQIILSKPELVKLLLVLH